MNAPSRKPMTVVVSMASMGWRVQHRRLSGVDESDHRSVDLALQSFAQAGIVVRQMIRRRGPRPESF
jgi:hypothetical protein